MTNMGIEIYAGNKFRFLPLIIVFCLFPEFQYSCFYKAFSTDNKMYCYELISKYVAGRNFYGHIFHSHDRTGDMRNCQYLSLLKWCTKTLPQIRPYMYLEEIGVCWGKTKHFQTIVLNENVTLCDCPGLVFPTFMSSKSDLVLNGVIPVDNLRDFMTPVRLLCSRVPMALISHYCKLDFPPNSHASHGNFLCKAYFTQKVCGIFWKFKNLHGPLTHVLKCFGIYNLESGEWRCKSNCTGQTTVSLNFRFQWKIC